MTNTLEMFRVDGWKRKPLWSSLFVAALTLATDPSLALKVASPARVTFLMVPKNPTLLSVLRHV